MIDRASPPTIHTVPTEMARAIAFWDCAALLSALWFGWWMALQGLFAWSLPVVVLVAAWTLTGEPATDVPYLGALASALRTKLGHRRAHEFVLAAWHHFTVRTWPEWRAWWASSPSRPVVALGHRQELAGPCRTYFSVTPTMNYSMASATERGDQMEALSRVLMGLSHPVQLIGTTRERSDTYDWPKPPRLSRGWLVVITGADPDQLGWRERTLRSALEGIGLRCSDYNDVDVLDRVFAKRGHVRVGAEVCTTLVLRRWPREVSPGWLGQALATDIPVDVAIHIEPQDPQRFARFLRQQQAMHTEPGAQKDAGSELGRTDAETVRLKLVARTDRPCNVAVALTVRAANAAQLRVRAETLTHELGLALADARSATLEHDRGFEATSPTGLMRLVGAWRTLDCTSVASTWLFQPATVDHADGAPIGTTRDGSMLVRLDPFDMSLESFGGIILAKVGAGKSFLLKLLTSRLRGVEIRIVEQRTPAEYANVPGAQSFNLADVPHAERAEHLRAYVSDLWDEAKRDPRPRLLVLDELWSLLRDPLLAALVEEIARIGRHHYLSLWIATQQVSELLNSDGGKAVLDNAAIRVFLKQHDRDLERLCNAVGLPAEARRFLRGAARGQALLDCGGMLIPVDIQATPSEHESSTTDPREGRHHEHSSAGRDDRSPSDVEGRETDLLTGLDADLRLAGTAARQ